MMLATVALAVAMLLISLAALGAQDEQRILERWEFRLNPEGLRVYSEVADEILWNRHMVDSSCESAVQARTEGNTEEAERFLVVAAWIFGHCSNGLVNMLRNVAKLTRHAEAIAPIPPASPGAYKLRRAALLAGLHNVVHHEIVTTRERLWLRFAVLRGTIRFCVAAFCAAVTKRDWDKMDAARQDLGTLTDESLATLRAVLTSLAAVPRPAEEHETA